MEPSAEQTPGVIASAKRLVKTLVAIARNRVELLAVEASEEAHRLLEVYLLTAALATVGTLALAMISLTIVYACWEEHRLAALVGLSIVYLLIAIIVAWRLHFRLKNSTPFSGTISELKKDMAVLEGRNNEPASTAQTNPDSGK